MSLHASWVHGNSVLLERPGSPGVTGKASVHAAFDGDPGDIIDLDGYAGAACLRIGWGARFVIFDTGSKNYEKSGSFWCHYAIPTPVIEDGHRAHADTVLINYESRDIQEISIAAVHVWDGNRRIFADNSPIQSPNDFNGGIAGQTSNSSVSPNLSKLWRGNIRLQPIYFGLGVSLLIRAQRAKDTFLEIRSVGVDFQIRE